MKTLAAVGGAAMIAMAVVAPAAGQDTNSGGTGYGQPTPDPSTIAPTSRANPGRTPRQERQRAPAPPTPEENIAAAQAIATSASVACQVNQANFLGQTAEGAKSYEAACATGPGYILISSAPPLAVDCVLLAGQAEIDRARDPLADVGTQCVIPQNLDIVRVVSAYAGEAGIACVVDQGASIGKSSEGNLIYEIGCNGADGYWIEKVATGWKATECAIISTQNANCRYSTPAELAATFKSRLAGSEAASCDVTEGRYMGANANGAFWEAKCGAGNGVIVRFNPEYAVQQVYPCETAQRIGGGCRLTIVPEIPAAAAPATQE
ncbi:hypothetical protein [Brevundimonas sp.]|uniref:hypothetical protein n=1 Tax=Brevundimonas sp. TaxID=1871086 RepID=UPI002625C89B|nr:hypothetical protein [Brevundimonas sp.]